MKIDRKIAFIGVGFMAGAMVEGIISTDLADPSEIYVINDAFPDIAREAAEKYGIKCGTAEDIADCKVVVFGVKPQIFPEAVEMPHCGRYWLRWLYGILCSAPGQ